MDYRITDFICDGDLSVSQPFYTEKLITLPNCFLCYDHQQTELPEITDTPRLKNPCELVIGNYNRLNKITDSVITEYNKIMLACPNVKFLFKTKGLLNSKICKEFLNKFDPSVQERIIIIDCTISHRDHLETYNLCDISIDTMIYSGTTTSCESLSMGVPVLSWYDNKTFFHASNVSASLLKNSDLDFYTCNDTDEMINKIKILLDKPNDFWKTNKEIVRNKFLNGLVCDKGVYLENIQELFMDLYEKHKTTF